MKQENVYKKDFAYLTIKRILDIIFSLTLLLMLSPLLLLLVFLMQISSPGPVFYRGLRTGQYGKPFRILKFRTMIVDAEKAGGMSTGKNDPRLTGIGKKLRAFKLDELPNLINVLIGQMSLVGPRPEMPAYTALYQGEERHILEVKPGITDFSSLYFLELSESLGETNVDQNYESKVMPIKNKLRIQYAKEASLKTDFLILLQTFLKLVKKHKYKSPLLKDGKNGL